MINIFLLMLGGFVVFTLGISIALGTANGFTYFLFFANIYCIISNIRRVLRGISVRVKKDDDDDDKKVNIEA